MKAGTLCEVVCSEFNEQERFGITEITVLAKTGDVAFVVNDDLYVTILLNGALILSSHGNYKIIIVS